MTTAYIFNLEYWHDWQWQVRNCITTASELQKHLPLTESELTALNKPLGLPFKITPYLLKLLIKNDIDGVLRKQFIPSVSEFTLSTSFISDPLEEDDHCFHKNIIRRHKHKIALICTNKCASYCRYCTRKRRVGCDSEFDLASCINYIEEHGEIRDVLLTGGDPLILDDKRLEEIIAAIRAIEHVEIIRIGTRMPVSLPMRITEDLVKILKKYHPIYINVHFSHACEITAECAAAIKLLANGGIPLGSQTVLLKGINDSTDCLTKLFRKLLTIRVKPYYLFNCDKAFDCERFYVDAQSGIELINAVQGQSSGLAVPHFVIDVPGDIGKCIIGPNNLDKLFKK
jgi:lysine 2,3-aminomutase